MGCVYVYSLQRANEEVEVPKALGDVFESLAGAVFLDSNLCLNTLWRVFFPLLRERIGTFVQSSAALPIAALAVFPLGCLSLSFPSSSPPPPFTLYCAF